MKYCLIPTILIWFGILTGCQKQKETSWDSSKLKNIVLDKPAERKTLDWDSLIEEIKVIPLESNEDYLISQINKMEVVGKYIYILDRNQQKLFIFQNDGKYFGRIEKGQAPNSSKTLNDFTFDKDGNLLVLSYLSIERFTPDGKKLGDYPIDFTVDKEINSINPFYIGRSKNSIYLWAGALGQTKESLKNSDAFAMVSLEGSDFTLKSKFFPIRRRLLEIPRYAEFNDSLFFTTFLGSDTIYSVNNDHVSPLYFVDFGGLSYSQFADIDDKNRNESEIRYKIIENAKLCGHLSSPVFNASHLLFEYIGPRGFVHQVICDRRSNRAKEGTMADRKFMPFVACSAYDDKIVAYSESNQLSQYIQNYPKDSKPPRKLQGVWDVLSRIKMDENPPVLLIKFKSF